MNTKLLIWPDCPAEFDSNGIALILHTVPADTNRTKARIIARDILYQVLDKLLPGMPIKLVEGARGPTLTNCDTHASLSYAHDKILIGLHKGSALGVDIVSNVHFPEIESLCRLYLPESDRKAIFDTPSNLQNLAFASAWANMEASCKSRGLPLTEISPEREKIYAECALLNCPQIAHYSIALALASLQKT